MNVALVLRGPLGSRLAVLGLLALLTAPVQASPDWRYRAEALTGWRHVQEREDGTTLVREEGFSMGIRAVVERPMGNWLLRVDGEFNRAALDYDGSTQAGAPLSTQTDWSSGRVGTTVGRQLDWAAGGRLSGRIEYQRRERDISSTPGVSGLTESYRTLWLGLGLTIKPIAPVTVELSFACAIVSNVDVDFASALDDAAIGVGHHCRVGLEAPFDIGRFGKSTVYVRPFVAWERYPQTAAVQLSSGGSLVGRVHLPNTEFVALGISIGVGRAFD